MEESWDSLSGIRGAGRVKDTLPLCGLVGKRHSCKVTLDLCQKLVDVEYRDSHGRANDDHRANSVVRERREGWLLYLAYEIQAELPILEIYFRNRRSTSIMLPILPLFFSRISC